jgi:copper chaperone NosL
VHLDGLPVPLFFSQVRDAIAYQRAPEQSHEILVIYVSDMGKAPSWEEPGAENWTPASTAYFVAGASTPGGMGAPEFVPFSARTAAADFAAKHGGHVLTLNEIADGDVLAPVEFATDADGNFIPPDGTATH